MIDATLLFEGFCLVVLALVCWCVFVCDYRRIRL